MKPSYEMMHVLTMASRQGTDIWHVPLVNGKGSQSRTVGRSLTIEACWRHGWLERGTSNLTQAGREALHAETERKERLQQKRDHANLMKNGHWERGDRCHGFWIFGSRVAVIGLGPKHLWDGVYRWSLDAPTVLKGEAKSLIEAKRAVEYALLGVGW